MLIMVLIVVLVSVFCLGASLGAGFAVIGLPQPARPGLASPFPLPSARVVLPWEMAVVKKESMSCRCRMSQAPSPRPLELELEPEA